MSAGTYGGASQWEMVTASPAASVYGGAPGGCCGWSGLPDVIGQILRRAVTCVSAM